MKKYIFILITILFVQCNNGSKKNKSSENIKVFSFVFGQNKFYDFYVNKTKINDNKSMKFIYDGERKDTIIFINNNLYFNQTKLNFIDKKKEMFNNKEFEISKYYYLKNKRYGNDFYIFFNQEVGLILIENLSNGRMDAYERPQLNEIHKKIAFKKIAFKKGKFELKYDNLESIERSGFLN